MLSLIYGRQPGSASQVRGWKASLHIGHSRASQTVPGVPSWNRKNQVSDVEHLYRSCSGAMWDDTEGQSWILVRECLGVPVSVGGERWKAWSGPHGEAL